MNSSDTNRQPLAGQHFQVAVIGGGITGVAIARECARAGKRTLLVEQHDFASGTTSRSSRILSGLRSLEQGDVAFAREKIREKQRLVRERPHLVHPSHFLMALSPDNRRSAMTARTALWLYRRMTGSKLDTSSFEMEHKKLERALDRGLRWSIFDYEDAQCEFPERLVAEWLCEAAAAGAVVRNHTQVLAVDLTHGRARGLMLRDWTRNAEERIEATWVVNATGPWVDKLCQRSAIRTRQPLVSGVRGSHIVVSNFPGAPTTTVYGEGIDGQPLYVVPWNEQILVGSTHAADATDPAKVHPAIDEIEYLLRSLARMFPKARMSANDIRYAFAGVRPVPSELKGNHAIASQPHALYDHEDDHVARMISVVGGSLSTAAAAARDCARKIGIRVAEPKEIGMADGAMLNPLFDQWVVDIAEAGNISEESSRAIVEWHGKQAMDIARMAMSSVELRTPICPHSQHIVAEAVHAYVHECAVTLGDVLLRRVPVALGACWSDSCSREAALRIGAVLGWNDQTTGANLEALEMERAAFLRKPRTGVRLETAAD
jgi:glycerol-3-phosphate dehydrogenase